MSRESARPNSSLFTDHRSHWRADSAGALGAGFIVIAFCLLLLWHDPLVFWNDDYELSILPVFTDMARSWSEGHWPLLSPYSWTCSNLAGEFQYGTFSIFVNAAVVLIWKFPLAFAQQAAALSMTHLFVLGAGAFLLARGRNLSTSLSIFVALVASLNGWIICWGASDWFGALGAFAWLPWAWWALEKSLDRQRTRWKFLWPAPFVYLLVTGGFPYTVLMLALLIAWLSIKALVETKNFLSILPVLIGVALGFGMSAPAWLAILDYAHGSGRQATASAAHWQWIVPMSALPGFILPSWTVRWADFSTRYLPHTATELASGLVAPAALIAGFIWRGRMLVRQFRWELLLLVLVLLLAMFPSTGVFRWSFRWLPLFHLVLALCAAEVLRIGPGSPTGSASVLLLSAAATAMLIFDSGGDYGANVMMIYFVIAIVWTVGEWFLRDAKFQEWSPAVVTFAILFATYVCIPPNCGVPKYNLAQKLLDPAPLDPQRLYLSLYPPAEFNYRIGKRSGAIGQIVRPGSTSMFGGVRFINGYSPILPGGVARAYYFSIHGEIEPNMGEYLIEYQGGAEQELARLGVDGIVIANEIEAQPQPADEWQLVFSNDEGQVYHRVGAPLETVRSFTSIDVRPDEQFAAAKISNVRDSRNEVKATVDLSANDRAALIAFSRPYFSEYVAQLDRKALRVESYRDLFPMVELPAGSRGELVLSYRPGWLVYGAAVSILCATFWLLSAGLSIRAHAR